VLVEDAGVGQRDGDVQPGLPADGRQERIWPLTGDDLRDGLRGERLDVRRVGELRVGHDRRRVGVHEHDPVPLGTQRLAGLHAGVVELAGLTDHDRSRAEQEDAPQVVAAGH
jgi:hypothetical protein